MIYNFTKRDIKMKRIDYFIRNIDKNIDKNIREISKKENKSISQLVKESLEKNYRVIKWKKLETIETLKGQRKIPIEKVEEVLKELDSWGYQW
jgi:flagellar biosynthesis chaperone FliJ